MSYDIRTMTRRDLALVLEWAEAEGWNPGKHDLDSFLATDPRGFFIGVLDGQPIASLSAVAYDDRYGFIGFYIVKPEFRGRGFGIKIWKHGMAYLGDRTIGLDGVVDQQDNYRKSGFEIATANVRFVGAPPTEAMPRPAASPPRLVDAATIPLSELSAFDQLYHPAPRDEFLSRWTRQAETTALAILSPGGSILGYGAIRPGAEAWRIGPLFARTADAARTLFGALAARTRGEKLCFDAPEANPAAAALARAFGLEPAFPTARMYTRATPRIDFGGVYAVTSLELG
jgi:Acetyltransferase (GNAT) domain/Acetyltransferase (GNAT) family